MEIEEKIRRIEEVVKMNNLYIREIWKGMKMAFKHAGINTGGIQKLTETISILMGNEVSEDESEVDIKEKMKDYVGRMFQ